MLPTTTYRLQLHAGFTLDDARGIAPYLGALGVTHCYLSPIFTATPGSTHGYDVCRHTEINPELGGQAAFDAFAAELSRLAMGVILDFVPNHMSNDPRTSDWWRDVLENGPSSPVARYFDIDWDPIKPELKERLLLPVLGEPYCDALERGALALRFEDGALVLAYGDLVIPINPRRAPIVLEHELATLERTLGAASREVREFLSILTALRNLPPYTERDRMKIAERQREKEVARARLAELARSSPAIRSHIDRAVTSFNGVTGDSASFDRLHELLELQAYRLASWKTASDEINYRRFFDINQLAALRVEDAEVFDAIHPLLLRLVADGRASGIRLDHIDGLFDPRAYLVRLAAAIDTGAADDPTSRAAPFVTVEKILSAGETLRENWPAAGTTGYTFLNDVNALFVDGRRAKAMIRIYARVTGHRTRFADVAYESKRLIVSTALSSEFQVLAQAVNRLSERDRRFRDFTLASIRRALHEVVACFPVYRTYVDSAGAMPADEMVVDAAIGEARRRNPALESSIFDFLRRVLLPTSPAAGPGVSADLEPAAMLQVAMRFQQYTAPVQAKGVEDTAFYRYHVLASLNEVGGDPTRFGRTVAEFHVANSDRFERWPGEMLATATHDTKRGEDARARINVLSEVPEEWYAAVSRWRRTNAPNRTQIDDSHAPDANDEYLFYQALVGAWPAEREADPVPREAPPDVTARMREYMLKAVKEAKVHSSWITPHAEYETAVDRFVEHSLSGRTAPLFLGSFVPFVRRIAGAGMVNSLAQLLLKIGSPGVPDFYQGTEFWDTSLVDPDNRRPVDWDLRRRTLRDLEPWLSRAAACTGGAEDAALEAEVGRMLEQWPDGRIKMYIMASCLQLRRKRTDLFARGDYEPLVTEGRHAEHLVAFSRRGAGERVVVVVPRLPLSLDPRRTDLPLGQVWGTTSVVLPTGAPNGFRDLLTGARHNAQASVDRLVLPASDVLRTCPVALLLTAL